MLEHKNATMHNCHDMSVRVRVHVVQLPINSSWGHTLNRAHHWLERTANCRVRVHNDNQVRESFEAIANSTIGHNLLYMCCRA